MARHRVAPTAQDIKSAIAAAKAGKGGPLARLVKAFSTDDLAKGFASAGRHLPDADYFSCWFGLEVALHHAAGRLDERLRWSNLRRTARLRAPEEAARG